MKIKLRNLHKKEVVMSTSSKTNVKATETKTTKTTKSAKAAADTAVAAKEEKAAKTVKETAKATEEKTVKAEPAKAEKKAVAEKKAPAKKAPAKKAAKPVETVQEVYFEYSGGQVLAEDIVGRIKEAYKSEGHRISSIKTLQVYIKPDERKAYYVINDKAEGKFVQF